MMPANKILTVAYGTFSCTLEGFDDPFSAMTDIAEYFRDLAAEDRYFGAEPPQPDPAMLRQIAESRVNRQIEAEPRKDGVTLRPTEDTAPMTEMVEAQADAAFEGDSDPIDDMVESAFDAQDAAQADAFTAGAHHSDVSDSVAEKLARIRGVVDADKADGYDEDQHAEEWTGFSTDEPAEEVEVTEALGTIETAAEERTEETLIADDVAESDEASEESSDPEPEIEVAGDDEIIAEAETSDVAGEDATDEDDAFDLEALEDALTDTDETEADADESIEIEATDEAVAEHEEELEAAETQDAEATDAETDGVEEDDADTPEEGDAQEPVRRVRRLRIRRRAQAELAAAAEAAEQIPAGSASAMEAAAEQAESDLDDDDEAELMAELAAIAADDEAAESQEDEAVEEDIDAESDTAVDELTSDDLEALLAAADDDPIGADEFEDEIALDDEDDDEDGDGPDLERLFAATDSRLEGAETSRVHANISHLKAAVAARRADSTMDEPKSDGTDAYRVDLANTVRPRRAETDEDAPRTERPVQRPAPLVLVSEQRVVDENEADEAEPVRPRRVTTRELLEAEAAEATANAEAAGIVSEGDEAGDEIDTADAQPDVDGEPGTDFEAFAMETGATDLSDVLEAAAAYSTQVMGDESFSRPRLLHLASEAAEDFSREEGLRAFGQLLRDGMIQKVSRGTFTLSESSRFLAAAARRAG